MKIRLKRPPFEIIMRTSWANVTQTKNNASYRNWQTRASQMNPSHNNWAAAPMPSEIIVTDLTSKPSKPKLFSSSNEKHTN